MNLTGGAYLRILPYRLQGLALEKMADRGEPIVLYFHPWELDPEQPVLLLNSFQGFITTRD